MRAYLTYRDTGNIYTWEKLNGEIQDEVEIELPRGAHEIETESGRGIELQDGQIIIDLLTERNNGVCQPYVIDCSYPNPNPIYMKVRKV